jgi:purine-cytosine permease-like protein
MASAHSTSTNWYSRLIQNEQIEDYSLRYAPASFRRWSPAIVASAGLGASAALFPFAISAVLTNASGSGNALIGNLIAVVFCVITGIPIAREIAKYNLDMDLLTRGAGFGYLGSTVTSLIYATFTFIYFAFEGSIMGQGLSGTFGIPLWLSYAIVAIAIIPMVTFGMSFLAKFQAWTWPVWAALLALPLAFVAAFGHHGIGSWLSYGGLHAKPSAGGLISAPAIGLAAAALMSLLAQIGEQADYVRFMPEPGTASPGGLKFWTFMSGPGWALIFLVTFTLGSYLTSYAGPHIGSTSNEPFQTFVFAYDRVLPHWLGLTCAFFLVVVAQAKINVTNAYSGSLSWSNFFSRLLHRHYGRFTWLLLQIGIGLVLMEANVFKEMAALLGFYSNVAVAWIVAVFADLTINRKLLKIGPSWIEFRRGYLYDFNPVGFGTMILASAISIAAYFGAFGPLLKSYSPFLAALAALILTPTIALITGGKYYLRRMPETAVTDSVAARSCTVCSDTFESFDTLTCPFHRGNICSLCCTVEASCGEMCKAGAAV